MRALLMRQEPEARGAGTLSCTRLDEANQISAPFGGLNRGSLSAGMEYSAFQGTRGWRPPCLSDRPSPARASQDSGYNGGSEMGSCAIPIPLAPAAGKAETITASSWPLIAALTRDAAGKPSYPPPVTTCRIRFRMKMKGLDINRKALL